MGNANLSEIENLSKDFKVTGVPFIDSLFLKVFNFYNHHIFKILVKLNLGVFLVHPFVAMFIISDGKHLVTYGTQFDVAWIGFGTLLLSYVVALVLFVMIEMPTINLFRLFLYRKQRMYEVNGSNKILSNGNSKKD